MFSKFCKEIRTSGSETQIDRHKPEDGYTWWHLSMNHMQLQVVIGKNSIIMVTTGTPRIR